MKGVSSLTGSQDCVKCRYADMDLFVVIGVDEHLAKHYAHLFIRDPLVVFQELLEQDDATSSDHFEVTFFKIYSIDRRQSLTADRYLHIPF